MLKSIKRLLNSSIDGIESVGKSAGKYLKVTDIHSTTWLKEAARESAMVEKESVVEMAKRMQELANQLSEINPEVITETKAMIEEAYKSSGI